MGALYATCDPSAFQSVFVMPPEALVTGWYVSDAGSTPSMITPLHGNIMNAMTFAFGWNAQL